MGNLSSVVLMSLNKSEPEEALQHLCEANLELYEARKALFDGDLEELKSAARPVAGPQPYLDEQYAMQVLQDQLTETIKSLRRLSADRPDEHPPGNIGNLLELAQAERDEG